MFKEPSVASRRTAHVARGYPQMDLLASLQGMSSVVATGVPVQVLLTQRVYA